MDPGLACESEQHRNVNRTAGRQFKARKGESCWIDVGIDFQQYTSQAVLLFQFGKYDMMMLYSLVKIM